MDSRKQSHSFALLAALLASASGIVSCGGGGYSVPGPGDSTSAAQNLICANACIASSSVATDQLRWSYVLVNDEQGARAFAAFGTGSDPRANVEIKGDDKIQLVTSQGTQPFYIPQAGNIGAALVDALVSLLSGAHPYESDLSQAQVAQAVQFQLIRGSTVYTSSATLPPNFTFTAPANNAVLPISTRTLQVSLTSNAFASFQILSVNCTDTSGNTASNSTGALGATPGPAVGGGASYSLNLGTVLDSLNFTTTYPRGLLSKCSFTLQATTNGTSQAATGFASTVVVAQQMRSVNLSMR